MNIKETIVQEGTQLSLLMSIHDNPVDFRYVDSLSNFARCPAQLLALLPDS